MTHNLKSKLLKLVEPEQELVTSRATQAERQRLSRLAYAALNRPERAVVDGQQLAALLDARGTKVMSTGSLKQYKERIETRRAAFYEGPSLGLLAMAIIVMITLAAVYQPDQSATVDRLVPVLFVVIIGSLAVTVLSMYVANLFARPWQQLPLGDYAGGVPPAWQTYLTELSAGNADLEYTIDSFHWGFHRYDHFLVVKLGAAQAYIYVWNDNYRHAA